MPAFFAKGFLSNHEQKDHPLILTPKNLISTGLPRHQDSLHLQLRDRLGANRHDLSRFPEKPSGEETIRDTGVKHKEKLIDSTTKSENP